MGLEFSIGLKFFIMLKRSGSPTGIGCPKSAMSSGRKSKLPPSSIHSSPNQGFTPLNSFESDVLGITPVDPDWQI